jgi:hypothetical protein
MDKEHTTRALGEAFSEHVRRLFGERMAAGETDAGAKDHFAVELRRAQRVHDDALARLDDAEDDKAPETDEAFRERMMPIAGDDSWRERIKAASGPELEKLGVHYNIERQAGVAKPKAPPEATADELAHEDDLSADETRFGEDHGDDRPDTADRVADRDGPIGLDHAGDRRVPRRAPAPGDTRPAA